MTDTNLMTRDLPEHTKCRATTARQQRRDPHASLVWQPGFTSSRKPFRKARLSRKRYPSPDSTGQTPNYEFILEDFSTSPLQVCKGTDQAKPWNGKSTGRSLPSLAVSTCISTSRSTDVSRGICFQNLAHRFDIVIARCRLSFKFGLHSKLMRVCR